MSPVAVRDLMTDIGLTTFPVTSGSKGLHLYAPLAADQFTGGLRVGETRCAAAGAGDAHAGHRDHDEEPARRQGVRGLESEQRGQDHDRTVLAARPRPPDRRRAAHLGRARRPGAAAAALRRGAGTRRATATCSPTRRRVRRLGPADDLPQHARRDENAGARPAGQARRGNDDTFVIQEHHARRLHYDFRLERDGVLVSWAVPKDLPETTSVNHLAVHTEDHPLDYATFEGAIPKGEYGGGKVNVWDSGTYEAEKFLDPRWKGMIVTLHGNKITGRYALIQTDGKNWLAHRMKEQTEPARRDLAPMLATHGSVANSKRRSGRSRASGTGTGCCSTPTTASHTPIAQRPGHHRRVPAIALPGSRFGRSPRDPRRRGGGT